MGDWRVAGVREELQAQGYGHGMDAVDRMIDFGRALEQLSGWQRLTVTLSGLGWTQREIAEMFHMTPQGVQSLLSTARRRIKKRMA